MTSRACPLCGSKDAGRVHAEARVDPGKLDAFAFSSRKTPDYMHHRLVLCGHCGLLYADPVPDLSSLHRSYREAAFDSGGEAHAAARTYMKSLRPWLVRLPDRKGALDIGTGDGAFLEELLGAGFEGVGGVEPSMAPIQAAREDIRPLIHQGMFRPEDLAEGSLALVTCFQTLEHLADPMEMCRGSQRVLKEGGALYVVCHDRLALSARLLGRKSPIFDIEHLQLFSRDTLKDLLERTGFQDVEVHSIFNRYPLAYWTKLFPFPGWLKPLLTGLMERTPLGRIPLALPAGNMAAIGFKRSGNLPAAR